MHTFHRGVLGLLSPLAPGRRPRTTVLPSRQQIIDIFRSFPHLVPLRPTSPLDLVAHQTLVPLFYHNSVGLVDVVAGERTRARELDAGQCTHVS